MKYCEKCHKYYFEDKSYCAECGNALVDKDKIKEKLVEKESLIEDIQTFGFEILLERFIFPIVIVISIAELILYWVEMVSGVQKILVEKSWSVFVVCAVIVTGLGYVQKWLIKNYAGNSEMKTFGISRAAWGDLEKVLSWIYPVVEVLCLILCLRYSGEVLQLLLSPEHEDNWSKLFNFTNWGKLPEQLNLEFYEELLTAVFKVVYKTKEWLLLSQGAELLWDIATVHREYDEEIKIWSNMKKRVIDFFNLSKGFGNGGNV